VREIAHENGQNPKESSLRIHVRIREIGTTQTENQTQSRGFEKSTVSQSYSNEFQRT